MIKQGISRHKLSAAMASQRVDRAVGIIYGVSVITVGSALGHGFSIDGKTLEQVAARGSEFSGGVRVKINHGTGFDAIVGALKSFRVEGEHVRADLHLIKNHPSYPTIMELAETMPGTFGLSIAFSGATEKVGDMKCARCEELYSVDLVDQPAANPTGLFSARVDFADVDNEMNAEELSKANEQGFLAALKNFFGDNATVTALTAKLEKTSSDLTAEQAKTKELEAKVSQAASDLSTVKQSLDTTSKELADAKTALEAKETEVEARAQAKANDLLAKAGHKPIKIDGGSENGGARTLDQVRAELNKESDPVKRGELAREARELRGHGDIFKNN